jgi:hypothetical protein
MPPRLKITNSLGTTQIDEKWENYGFKQVVPVYFDVSEPTYYTFSATGLAVLLAFRATTLRVIPLSSYIDGATWYFNYRIDPPFDSGGGAETVYFYVFDVPGSSFPTTGPRLRIVHQGKLVFHSDMRPMVVPSGSVRACNVDYTGASGRIFAALVLINPVRNEFNGSTYTQWTRALRVSGSSIISSDRIIGPGSAIEFANEGLYAPVDVTHY